MAYNTDIAVREVQIYQEYQIALTDTSVSTALALAFQNNSASGAPDPSQVVILEARGDNVVFKFGGSGVAANRTLSSNALAAGNFSIAQGAIFGTAINGQTQNFVSCQSEGAGSATTFGIIRLGKFSL